MTWQPAKDNGPPEPSGTGETVPRASGIIALIRPQDGDLMEELPAAVKGDFEICTTVREFIERCTDSRYAVAVLPLGVLPDDHRALLRGTLAAMRLRPSIVMYSPGGGPTRWRGSIDAGDLTVVVRPFTAERLHSAIMRATEDFTARANRLQC
jgi:AmiR/NasT family two-component response regulator